ncbi:Cys-rich domain containing protein [Musa troglodytarum]|uniref:Cys-rich domain containing protein n=1 Tax=Musa troglodytarum TaxID=320322 RepID=A0A9E7F7C5_9LILI|nr:Cys-rich domain containing protein [Musa troglodytarum]
MGSLGAMPVSEVQRVPVAGTQEEEAVGGEVAAVLDFDMLCATVALQTQGMSLERVAGKRRWRRRGRRRRDGVRWRAADVEGDVTDCFDDRRIAIQAACCPCYRFGMNMRRANLGSCFLQATAHSIFIVAALFSFIAFVITEPVLLLVHGNCFYLLIRLYLGHFRTRLKKQFNIRVSIYFLFIIIVYFLLLYFIYHNQLYFSLLY